MTVTTALKYTFYDPFLVLDLADEDSVRLVWQPLLVDDTKDHEESPTSPIVDP